MDRRYELNKNSKVDKVNDTFIYITSFTYSIVLLFSFFVVITSNSRYSFDLLRFRHDLLSGADILWSKHGRRSPLETIPNIPTYKSHKNTSNTYFQSNRTNQLFLVI